MRALLIADPWDQIRPKTDSSLTLVREMLRRRYQVYWATPPDLSFVEGHLWVRASRILECAEGQMPRGEAAQVLPLKKCPQVWIRKDPPFDRDYVKLCWGLGLERGRCLLLNSVDALLRYHEKLLPFEAMRQGYLKPADIVPTAYGNPPQRESWLRRWDRWVCKPFWGFAGSEVRLETDPPAAQANELVQPFLPEVQTVGDRRLLYVGGRYAGDFVRFPPQGAIVSNLAQGGSAVLVPLTPKQKSVVDRLGKFLREIGVALAGADMIGHRISEVNITSPTGLQTYRELAGVNLACPLLDYAESRLLKRIS